jgi:hypothetical protein
VRGAIWKDALEAERLRVEASLHEYGMMDPERYKEIYPRYVKLRERVGETVFMLANRALIEVDRLQRTLEPAKYMRIPGNEARAWPRVTRSAIAHRRKQHAVGQGGFHSAIVREHSGHRPPAFTEAGTPSVFYVYDCGSDPRAHVDREIDDSIAARQGRSLDLLFLSHFDRDHICGTPRLLAKKRGLQVDTIVMPYVDEAERLAAFGRSAPSGDAKAEKFFAEMVVDPIRTLRRFGPRQIIFVITGEGAPPPLPPSEAPVGPIDRRPTWKVTGRHGPPQVWATDESDAIVMRDPSFETVGVGGVGGWRLIPYVDRAPPAVVETFERLVEALLDWPVRSFQKKIVHAAIRHELVTKHRSAMARAYRYAFEDKNITSLSLYSGPVNPAGAGAVQLRPLAPAADTAKVAWIGTGDADLKDHNSISRFEAHYRGLIDYVSTFVLPHHGSIHNSDPLRLVSDADRFVVSAEPSHDWEHPAKSIRAAVKQLPRAFHHVKSRPSSALDEAVIVYWP